MIADLQMSAQRCGPAHFEVASRKATSQRAYAREHDVPRTTLQHWLSRKGELDASPAMVTFFESPDGVAFLHRLTAALQFVITYVGANGLRSIQKVIEVAGLEPFVANSFGSRQKLGRQMEQHIGMFGREQRKELAAKMSPKQITICEDETFHPATCLVAIEPVSNFILVEAYAERRDAATWNATLTEGLQGLPVRVIQSTSDEGKGPLAHVREGLGTHHSPDLFHGQQELTRATSVGLSARVRHAEQAARDAQADTESQRQAAQSWVQVPTAPVVPPTSRSGPLRPRWYSSGPSKHSRWPGRSKSAPREPSEELGRSIIRYLWPLGHRRAQPR